MSLERTVKWIDKTEGRDKFCKAIQYSCRFLKYQAQQRGNKQGAKQFDALFSNMRDARKLFRLFKTVNEVKKIKDLFGSKTPYSFDNIMNILVRFFFGLYWVFDNLSILSKIKIINQDAKSHGKTGATFWFLALICNLIVVVKDIITNTQKIEVLRRAYLSSANEEEVQKKRKEFLEAQKKMYSLGLNVLKLVGDMLPAGQASEIIPKVFGVSASDGTCGIGGLIAALITSYQLYD